MKKINDKSDLMKQIESKEGMMIEEVLRIKYVDENKPLSKIAEELSITYRTAFKWLNKAGIYSRRLRIEDSDF
jgi:transposase-like protein